MLGPILIVGGLAALAYSASRPATLLVQLIVRSTVKRDDADAQARLKSNGMGRGWLVTNASPRDEDPYLWDVTAMVRDGGGREGPEWRIVGSRVMGKA